MKILFCGTIVPEEIEYHTENISAAGNRFQSNVVRNLQDMGHEVYQYSYVGIDISKEQEQILEDRSENSRNECYVIRSRGILKSVAKYCRIVRQAINDMDIVVCYNIIYAWILLPVWCGNKGIAIVADYSESISYNNMIKKLYAWVQLWSMRRFHTVIGLSANIRSKLRKRQRFLLMEGGIDQEFYDAFSYCPYQKGKRMVFLYSGLLSRVTGVDILLNAVKKIKRDDIIVSITGKGPLEEQVRQMAAEDERIHYQGHLVYTEYIETLQKADILINPRNMNMPENQNNFPSKIMDYLAAGKPVVSTKFVGWEKFVENIAFCESNEDDLKACLEDMIEKIKNGIDIYHINREKARQFEWKYQLKRIFGA